MKKLGLIGGTGPESTLLYYKRINDAVCKKTAGKAFPEIIIESLDMCKTLDHIERKDYEGLSE
ncbi:MAG: aspartate racemase, partial [Huintestinicola sp.]